MSKDKSPRKDNRNGDRPLGRPRVPISQSLKDHRYVLSTEGPTEGKPDTAEQAFLRTIKATNPVKFYEKKELLEQDYKKQLAVVKQQLYEQDRSPSAKLENTSEGLLHLIDSLLSEKAV